MRLKTLLKLCEALNVLPNDILTTDEMDLEADRSELIARLTDSPPSNQEAALKLLKVFFDAIGNEPRKP